MSVEQAQARLDKWCAARGDVRLRATADGRATVAALAKAEPLAPMPAPFPAVPTVMRVVSAQALVSFRGNRYSVPPELHGATLSVSVRLGGAHLDIATEPGPGRASALPTVIARHVLAPAGAGATVRDHGHVTALEQAAAAASTSARPHRGRESRPPSPAALAHAATLRAGSHRTEHAVNEAVIDLAAYAAAANGRNTLTPPPETTLPNTLPNTLQYTTEETNHQ